MKSLKLFLLVIGCLLVNLSSQAWAATALKYDLPTDGTIASVAQSNTYTLLVNASDVLSFTVVTTSSTSGTLGPCIVLYDPNAKLVDSAGGSYNQDVEMNGYKALLTGTYTVLIKDCADTATGDYLLFVQKTNNPIGVVPLPYASVQTGKINSEALSNSYKIGANANDVLDFTVVTTISATITLGPCIQLYDTTGTPVLDSAGGSYNQDVEMNQYTIPATGTYYVFIKDCADRAIGSYVLFVQKMNDPINSVPIVYGQVQAGAISSPAQSNAYTLIGTMNDLLNFTVVTTKSTSSTLGPCIAIYNSTGKPPLDSAGGSYAQTVEMNGYSVPASGTYNVFIKDCADRATGTYTLQTECVVGACKLPIPTIAGISPTSAIAGGAGFTLTVNGLGYANNEANSVVEWNGHSLTTTFVSTNQLKAAVPSTDIGSAGTAQITVYTPAPGGGTSDVVDFTVKNPVPTLTTISPVSAIAGGPTFTLTLTGTNFMKGTTGSQVYWNGISVSTTFVSATELQAAIPATDIAIANASVPVTVVNPAPGGGTTTAQNFVINNPVPVITKLSPASTLASGAAFTLTVNGSNFVATSQVNWGVSGLPTTYVSANELQATASAADIAIAGTISVTVSNPTPGGGASSSALFSINNPVPAITSVSPTSATAGNPGFTLTVIGSKFVKGSVVNWGGSPRVTTLVSATQLTAQITAADIATANSSVPITVTNPAPGGGTSNTIKFSVNPSGLPVITSLAPTSATAGAPAFTITVNGSNFFSASVIYWNGSPATTKYVSATELQASITAADIATANSAVPVTVFNPGSAGGISNPVDFTINNPLPTTASLSPASAIVGGPAFTLTVNGTNFVKTSVVKWNTTSLTPTFVSATQLTVAVPASDIAKVGTASVTVVNPAPVGGTSNAQVFAINNPVPIATSLSPSSALVGGPAFTLTVNGANFVASSNVNWSTTSLTPATVSPTQLTVAIPASYLAVAGNFPVTVTNPSPGGGTSTASAATTFVVNNPVPVLASISPASIIAGGNGFTLTATGSSFVAGSIVKWNGHSLTTTYVSATELQAAVPASDTLDGVIKVTVSSPAPGGGSSAAQTLTIDNPVPVVMSLSPSSVKAGSASFTLTVTGFNYNEGAVIQWNGAALATAFVSDTQLQAIIPASAIATQGSATVTVANPAPTPSPSNAATFTIN